MIGHLQTNKAKKAIEIFDMIQSVDSIALADEINKHASNQDRTIDILIQVNIGADEHKSGIDPDQASSLGGHILTLQHIRLRGLMTILPLALPSKATEDLYANLRVLRDTLQSDLQIELPHLSMGMSADFELAVAAGATIVRVGQAIFQGTNEQ
jgi:hypothetical protein